MGGRIDTKYIYDSKGYVYQAISNDSIYKKATFIQGSIRYQNVGITLH